MMKKWLLFFMLLTSPAMFAQEALVTLRSTVTGNQEQPRVMYLVPWQQPGQLEFDYDMQGSFADEVFAPIDREEFVRGLDYRAMIDGSFEEDAARE